MQRSISAWSIGPAFLAGWVLALAVVGSMVLVLANLGKISTGGTPSTLAYVIKLLLGLLFLFMAIRQWRCRPKEGEEPHMPKWMATIDEFTAGQSAEKTLTSWKVWMVANNATVSFIVLLVFGVLLIGQALGGLIG